MSLLRATSRSPLQRADLPFCTCRSRIHQADPGTSGTLSVHLPVESRRVANIIFLTSNDLLDLIPLTPDHPNSADLQYERFAVPSARYL